MNTLFQALVATHGIAAIEITIPMRPVQVMGLPGLPMIAFTSSNDEAVPVPCVIEEDRYPVHEGYKITLRSKIHGYGREHFYQCDLESLINRGEASLRVLIQDEAAA